LDHVDVVEIGTIEERARDKIEYIKDYLGADQRFDVFIEDMSTE